MKTTMKSHVWKFKERVKKGIKEVDIYKCRFCGKEYETEKGCVPSNSMKGCKR